MYIATCLKGIEDICATEVKGKKILPGRVKFNTKVRDFKSVINVYKLIKKFKFKDKYEIITKIKKYPIKGKFKVVCNRQGQHDFNSFEIQRLLGLYLHNKGFYSDFKAPNTIIYVDIIQDNCFIGILIKENLNKRDYRYKLIADTLNPCLAYTILKLGKCKKNDLIVDPFCRDGIICIEAARLGCKVFGFSQNTRNARINAKIAKQDLDLSNKDLDWLDTTFDKNTVKIISYVPSPSYTKPEEFIDKLIKELFNQADYIVKDYMVLISQKVELIMKYAKGFKLLEKRTIPIGATNYIILVFKKII